MSSTVEGGLRGVRFTVETGEWVRFPCFEDGLPLSALGETEYALCLINEWFGCCGRPPHKCNGMFLFQVCISVQRGIAGIYSVIVFVCSPSDQTQSVLEPSCHCIRSFSALLLTLQSPTHNELFHVLFNAHQRTSRCTCLFGWGRTCSLARAQKPSDNPSRGLHSDSKWR